MSLTADTYILATLLVFAIALVFSMLGLGGGMLYVPVFKWLALPVKTVAVPLSLLLNGVTTASALVRYAREGMVDFRGSLPAALTALASLCSQTAGPPREGEDTRLSKGQAPGRRHRRGRLRGLHGRPAGGGRRLHVGAHSERATCARPAGASWA